jgi:hypothetical protein
MKVHLPIVGKATGSSAGLIYQSYWGNTYTRSFPFSFHYPDTAKQQICQFDFFQIQRAWWPIYDRLKRSIPKQCRRNTNVYNELSNGLYKVFMTYSEKKRGNVIPIWGLDKRKTVNVDIINSAIKIDKSVVKVTTDFKVVQTKRSFSPMDCNVLLCNVNRQEFYLQVFAYETEFIDVQFFVGSEWEQTEIILAYLALSNDEFFTNFFLCGQ